MELKKNPKLDYRKKSGLFFNIGLVMSLLLVISAFEMKFQDNLVMVDYRHDRSDEDLYVLPVVEHKPPPIPKVVPVVIKEVDDNKELENPPLEMTLDPNEVALVEQIIYEAPELADESTDVIHDIVERMPDFPGGISEFYKFISKTLQYPSNAKRLNIQGKVFVHFVVDKDGSLTDLKIVKGLGAGCDEEVLRVVSTSPKWNPGKQRGIPVKVRMMLPVTFRLQ